LVRHRWSTCAVAVGLSLAAVAAPASAAPWGDPPPPQQVVPGLVVEKAEPEPRMPAVDPQAVARIQRKLRVPTSLDLTVAHANITSRQSTTAFAADLSRVLAAQPDLVTLNEAVRPDEMLAREGYDHYRGFDSRWTMETTVMWSEERFEVVSTGTRYLHRRPGTWGTRAVNWVVLQDRRTDKTLSLVSAHPSPEGPSSQGLLPVYMGGLATLVRELAVSGPVFVGGDLNAHYTSGRFPRPALGGAGLTPTYDVWGMPPGGTGDHGGATIDYLLYQPAAGVASTAQWKIELASDHDAVLGTFTWTF
jgi:endonuclease/exonuclease/phosphatase (EEP) superfamily protein YafD